MQMQGTVKNGPAELLKKAQKAVSQGNPIGMLEALTESKFLDGLTRRLQKKWSDSLPPSEVDDSIAQAVDAACEAISKGRRIHNLGAWLWKAATNIANDKWQLDYAHRADFEDAMRQVGVEPGEKLFNREDPDLEDTRRKEAIRIARKLLPQIGEGQVLDVMELVIDAAEDRLPDLPSSSIADALGISKNAARTLVSRGLRRLRRLAEQEGVEAPTELPDTDTDEENEEDNNG